MRALRTIGTNFFLYALKAMKPGISESYKIPAMKICRYLKVDINKMELLQSQAPENKELSGSSASARHGTFDI